MAARPDADCPTVLTRPAIPLALAAQAVTPEQRAARDARDVEALPESGNLRGFLHIAHKAELELAARKTTLRAAASEQFKTIRTRGQARYYVSLVRQKIKEAKVLGIAPKIDAGPAKARKPARAAKRSGSGRGQRPKRRR
jgi:hypothetical protein